MQQIRVKIFHFLFNSFKKQQKKYWAQYKKPTTCKRNAWILPFFITKTYSTPKDTHENM